MPQSFEQKALTELEKFPRWNDLTISEKDYLRLFVKGMLSSLKEEIKGKKLSRENCPIYIDEWKDYNQAIHDILKLID